MEEHIGKSKIVVVGSLNMDFVVRAPRIPSPGETVLGADDLQAIPGGKGANQAFAAAKLGSTVTMIGRVGADMFGQKLVENLANAGVSVQHIATDSDASTGIAMIVVDQDSQNSIVVSSGANANLSADHINEAEAEFVDADIVLMQLEIPLATVVAACRLAKKHDVRILLNPAPAQKLPTELLSLVDIIVPNETETELLTGHEVHQDLDVPLAAKTFRDAGIDSVVITRGKQGSSVVTNDDVCHIAPFDVDAVDSTAAGDAFVAGLAVSLTEGASLKDAARFGNAVGALAATVHGAQPSMPSRSRVEEFVRKQTAD